jgi:hypothetical protein
MPPFSNTEATFDLAYTWGLPPSSYLATRELARLTLLRSRIESRHELRNRVIRLPRSRRAEA